VVGQVIIRQLRVKSPSSSCQLSTLIHHDSECFITYTETTRDNASFGVHTAHHYRTAHDTGAAPFHGQFALYGGDGYLWSFPAGYQR